MVHYYRKLEYPFNNNAPFSKWSQQHNPPSTSSTTGPSFPWSQSSALLFLLVTAGGSLPQILLSSTLPYNTLLARCFRLLHWYPLTDNDARKVNSAIMWKPLCVLFTWRTQFVTVCASGHRHMGTLYNGKSGPSCVTVMAAPNVTSTKYVYIYIWVK